MEVILNEDVQKLGKAGTIVKVKDGFARNFLIPNGLAVPANSANLRRLQQEQQRKQSQIENLKKEAEELKDKLTQLSLTIASLTQEDENLYGGITAQDISAALKEESFDIDKSQIILSKPIKSLGIYEVPVKLHPEITVNLKVWVVKK
ncbi:MAG: 50S ribosomal protein L9, partial [Candidatus Omnitrophica bacterium]|nr:50S ribosomal protein L9 [Candidatus Omnitrophota bacterium]MBL7210398.1 50S ribosomal protein L9 [Candidatus Omnitrophota bacterium]